MELYNSLHDRLNEHIKNVLILFTLFIIQMQNLQLHISSIKTGQVLQDLLNIFNYKSSIKMVKT